MEVNSKSVLSMITRRFNLKRSTIEERMQLQKIVYLIQAGGIHLGYGFGWNKYGPYSQDLANDAYAVLSVEPDKYGETKTWVFNAATEKKLKSFEGFLSKLKEDRNKMLELVASVDFMNRIWGILFEPLADFVKEFRVHKKTLLNGSEFADEDVKKAVELQEELRKLN
jgi:uncharacterized protein YwgA